MAIRDEMYRMIVQEIDDRVRQEQFNIHVDSNRAKAVANMLTELSVDSNRDAEQLVNQYVVGIKNICNTK